MNRNDAGIDFEDMGDALMNWEAGRCRWRKKYRGKWLQISPSALGGTNATDTKLAANQWYREQQAQRDQELAIETPRSNEWWEYRRELECVQSAINTLSAVMRSDPETQSMLVPKVELLKQKEAVLSRVLQQSTLPPLNDRLRNPLTVSPEQIEKEAVWEVEQQIADRLYGQMPNPFDYLFLRSLPLNEEQNTVSYISTAPSDPPTFTTTNGNSEPSIYDERVHAVAETIAGLKDSVVARKKKELGLIESEYERGQINQILKEAGTAVPVSLKLGHHIDKFLEYQQRRHATKKISAGRLGKIVNTMESYKRFASSILNGSVNRIGTSEHINAYFRSLEDLVIAQKIKPEYANNLFGTFRMLIGWLSDTEVLKEYPRCLQRKSKTFTFPVDRQKPTTVALEWVHAILNAASPRLKLCILLTLNCGFGASELGQLEKSEYDPKEGRIKHKRCKTKDSPNAPEVCYKLWDCTKELLDQAIVERAQYPPRPMSAKYLLVNTNGKPLWYEYVADGKSKKSDNISCDFRRLITKLRESDPSVPSISYYQFRKTSASLIKNEPKYRMLNELWLAHSPRSVADRHYNAIGDTILDECIAWLHGKIFGNC